MNNYNYEYLQFLRDENTELIKKVNRIVEMLELPDSQLHRNISREIEESN